MSAPALPGPGAGSAGERLDPRHARGVLAVLAGCALMVMYVETMVLPGLVKFSQFFDNAPFSTIAWILSAYLLVGVVATPIFGKLGDIYGKKRMLVLVLSTYAVAVTLAGFSPDIGDLFGMSRTNELYLFIGLRGVQGIGMAMFPLAFAMIGEVFPPQAIAPAQGTISAMFAAGASLGLAGGGYLTQSYGWQLTYHTVIPAAILVTILAVVMLKESKHRLAQKLDVPGSVFLGIALGSALLALTQEQSWGWTTFSAVTVGGVGIGVPDFIILAVVATIAFLLWEPQSSTPIVDFARLKERNIVVSNINGLFVGMAMFLLFVTNTYLTQVPGDGLGLDPFQSGLLSVPGAASMLIAGPFMGRATSRIGPRPVMAIGFGLIAVGGLLLAFLNRNWVEMAILPIPFFVGMVSVMISMTNVVVVSSRKTETGIQLGMNLTFRNLGSAIGPVVATTIILSSTSVFLLHGFPAILPNLAGFRDVYLLVAGLGVFGMLLSLLLRNYRYSADGTRQDDAARAPAAPSPAATPARGFSAETKEA
jgi:MFS family permease